MPNQKIGSDSDFYNAISSLKRATGIADSKTQPDSRQGIICRVYTPDLESAQILGNLISQALMDTSGKPESYWSKKIIPDITGPHFGLRIDKFIKTGDYLVGFLVNDKTLMPFVGKLAEKTAQLISPDKRSPRER